MDGPPYQGCSQDKSDDYQFHKLLRKDNNDVADGCAKDLADAEADLYYTGDLPQLLDKEQSPAVGSIAGTRRSETQDSFFPETEVSCQEIGDLLAYQQGPLTKACAITN